MQRSIVFGILAAVIAVSFFLPWINTPFGQSVSLFDAVSQAKPRDLSNTPIGGYVFILSFVLAAITAVRGFMQRCGKALALVTGLLPLGLLAYVAFRASSELKRSGLPLPKNADFDQIMKIAGELLGMGAYAYVLGAIALTVAALVMRGR